MLALIMQISNESERGWRRGHIRKVRERAEYIGGRGLEEGSFKEREK